MSQENVEMVRSIYTAWEGGDFSATEWLHPEIPAPPARGIRGPTGFRGRGTTEIGLASVSPATPVANGESVIQAEAAGDAGEISPESTLVALGRLANALACPFSG